MKHSLLILLAFLILSCGQNKRTASDSEQDNPIVQNATSDGDFDWILGNWKRTNDEDGKQTFEQWSKRNETHYIGIGYTLQEADTVSQEKMEFIKSEQQWTLLVNTPSEPEATSFTLISLNEESFTFQNPDNEFPKLIKYWKEDGKMNAIISNDEFEIVYEFERENS